MALYKLTFFTLHYITLQLCCMHCSLQSGCGSVSSANEETVLSAITTMMFLMTPSSKPGKESFFSDKKTWIILHIQPMYLLLCGE